MDRYRLGPLREVRELDVRAKRQDLAAAVGEARATAEETAAAAHRIARARAALAEAGRARDALLAAAAISTAALVLADRYAARRRRELDGAVGEHARVAALHAGRLEVVEGVRGRLTAARADKELIERHFARWREARDKLAARRDD